MASTDRLSFDSIELDTLEDKMIEWTGYIQGVPLTTSWKNIGLAASLGGTIERKYFSLNCTNAADPYLTIKRAGIYYFNIYNAQFNEGGNVDAAQIAWTCIMKDDTVAIQEAHYLYWPGSISAICFKNDGMLILQKGVNLRAMYSKSGISNYNIYGVGYITCQVVHIKDLEDSDFT